MSVEVLDALVGNLVARILLFGDSRAKLFVKALDLIKLASTGILASTLLVADFIGLSDKFLATFLGGRLVVLILASYGELDLLFDGVLELSLVYWKCVSVVECATIHI